MVFERAWLRPRARAAALGRARDPKPFLPAGGKGGARGRGGLHSGARPHHHVRVREKRLVGGHAGGSSQSRGQSGQRSEEHTSELQSPCNLVCRLLLEKKKKK